MSVIEVVTYVLVCDWCAASLGWPVNNREEADTGVVFCGDRCRDLWRVERAAQTACAERLMRGAWMGGPVTR